MKTFLDEFITTLSGNRRRRVYDLLAAAKVDKSDLDRISLRLAEIKLSSPLVINPELFAGRILATRTQTIYNDTIQKLIELYNASNLTSVLLDTHTSILGSEIKALEDDIDAMVKSMDNYAFTLADNGAYDFAYLETFNDDTIRLMDSAVTYTDRNDLDFRADEQCFVNTAAGILTLTPAVEVSHSMTGRVLNSNCAAYITSDTGLFNAFSSEVGSGWRVAVSSPRPVSATLGDRTRQGAQFELEMVLTTPSPSDVLVVTPLANKPFEILLLEAFISKENKEISKITLVDGIEVIDRPKDFGFPLNTISRIRMIINQPVYQRGQLTPLPSEEIHRTLDMAVRSNAEDSKDAEVKQRVYRFNRKALTDAFLFSINKTTNKNETAMFRARLPVIDFDPSRGPLNVVSFVKNERKTYGQEDLWKTSSPVNNIFRRMIHESLLASNPGMLSGFKSILSGQRFYSSAMELNSAFKTGNLVPEPGATGVDANVDAVNMANFATNGKFLNYEYDLGFRNLEIGRGERVFRGVFMTKALPANSDSGEVKIKVDDTNYEAVNSDRNSKTVTSIEYSVTNRSNPQFESDWIPILPINRDRFITAERLFFKNNGAAYVRFPASKEANFTIYRNGYNLSNEIQQSTIEKLQSQDEQFLIGFKLPLQYVKQGDIYTVDYEVYGDYTRVNFTEQGFGQTNVATAFDNKGAGETFVGTRSSKTIQLSNDPYIDYQAALLNGSYITPDSEFDTTTTVVGMDMTTGAALTTSVITTLGFAGSYQPMTIVMSDGSIARNQTNYIGRSQNNLTSFPETQTVYVQSGRNITFNRALTEQFTVYYQYLPSNLKARIVMRVNDINYVTPEVNSIQIKSKTRIADPRRTT